MAQENAPHPSGQPNVLDPVDALIDRIAEAVVGKMEERRKIDAIAYAVLERLQAAPPRTEAAKDEPSCAAQGQEGET
ncbi:MAG TPA: hypothetical protein DGT21_10915 [Armatimonadetes bacterium]|nr:hypothetical protein [Armatimonadota bacterium]